MYKHIATNHKRRQYKDRWDTGIHIGLVEKSRMLVGTTRGVLVKRIKRSLPIRFCELDFVNHGNPARRRGTHHGMLAARCDQTTCAGARVASEGSQRKSARDGSIRILHPKGCGTSTVQIYRWLRGLRDSQRRTGGQGSTVKKIETRLRPILSQESDPIRRRVEDARRRREFAGVPPDPRPRRSRGVACCWDWRVGNTVSGPGRRIPSETTHICEGASPDRNTDARLDVELVHELMRLGTAGWSPN